MHTLWVWGHAWGAQGAQRVCQRGARVPEAASSETAGHLQHTRLGRFWSENRQGARQDRNRLVLSSPEVVEWSPS